MQFNQSVPQATVIPVLAYADAEQAAAWLCDVFGFSVRLRVGGHRVQLNVGDGAMIVRELREGEAVETNGKGVYIMVRVQDADAHCRHAQSRGAKITAQPETYPYGERQYCAEDLAGYAWTFSQSVADADPRVWLALPAFR